jgi:hypothetical protein
MQKTKQLVIIFGILAVIALIIIKFPLLAIAIFLVLSGINFVFNLFDRGKKKAGIEFLKDIFLRW